MRESIFLSIYRVYNKRVYKGNKRKGKKVAVKGKCGKECSSFLYIDIVYNSIIDIRKRKRAGKDMFIIYRYIERLLL